ncbi:MAG TPA: M3 family metallopeptidase [Bryobacteraceae bacterium]|nr:M3 family metallopeptidase [Bryobacteraceae bacterium]HOQ46027.1 M3 family metallopeptidase [Bryobacteraceae bacterium]HPU72863.1 M3 family metallopeptidase [Bryobacteraceae bacterium]
MAADFNPLLRLDFRIPFDRIRAEHVEPGIQQLLQEARERLEALANDGSAPTFRNTLRKLDLLSEPLDRAMAVVKHLESVATYPELRAAHNRVEPAVSEFHTNIPLHEGLWKRLKDYAVTKAAGRLRGERRRYLTKTLDEFRRHGAELGPAGKARLAEIDVELAKLTTRFSENVLDATNAFDLVIKEESRLAGLPPNAVAAARESAAKKGIEGWRFTLQAPSYTPLMTYLDDAGIRERMYRAFVTRASGGDFDNRSLIVRILELRREKAQLLGYKNFADYALADRMARTGEQALEFLKELKEKTQARYEEENRELLEFRRSLEGPGAPELAPWDLAYYAEKQRAALFDFDEEALRPYFPLEKVVEGMFEIAARLYGICVEEEKGAPTWDPSVRYYTIRDADGIKLGAFYADWYPRENKRGGAWMDAFITGHPTKDGFQPHLGAICGNLTPPLADKPALLTHQEVETIFHEFGHLLHQCLSKVDIRSLAGTNVAWDFVELPSQIMENWCWEREALDLFARHYQTGEPIPEDLYQKMKRARNFRAANAQMRQLGFGFLDLLLHIEYSPERDGDVIEYSRRILQEFTPAKLDETYAMVASFTHLFAAPTGYGAGYYSYKWAEVLEADAFTRFRQAGVFNREVGMEFRHHILEKGDSEDPAVLYRSFMGRDPDPNALLARLGLL